MSIAVQPTTQQHQQHWNPTFQKNYAKWGNQQKQWDRNQVINSEYTSIDDPEVLCENILRDPRYNRLRTKWNPKLSDKGGVKQKAKNIIDPIHIPYVGAAVAWKRAGQANQAREKVEKLKDENQNAPQEAVLDAMHTNSKVNQAGLTAKAGAKTFFMFFPLVYAIPAGDQYISNVAGKVASKGVQKAAEKATEKSENQDDIAQTDVNDSWGASKALLQYLGEPQNSDPVYQTWESSRLKLKQFFGCDPQDNVWLMEPKGEDLKRIEDAEDSEGGYNLSTINVPLLVLLWRIYDCWSEQYADKLTTENHKTTRQKRERAEDERHVLEMINPVDPHIQQLDAASEKEIVRMLRDTNSWGYGNHPIFSFLEDRPETKREKRLNWMLKTFTHTFLEAKMGWGYFSDPTNTGKQGKLLAVVFFERAEQDHYEPSDVLKTFSGMMNLKTDYPAISKRLSWEQNIMRTQIGNEAENSRGILHYYGCLPTPEGHKALSILLRTQIEYTSLPSYCSEYSSAHDRIHLLESIGFHQKSVGNMTNEQQNALVLDAKDSDSPLRMSIVEHCPPTRSENAYLVPDALHSNKNQA